MIKLLIRFGITTNKEVAGVRNMAHSIVPVLLLLAFFDVRVDAQEVSLIQQEIQKRKESVLLGQELLLQGDASYNKQEYGKAVQSYSKAFDMIPQGAVTAEIKQAAAQRYAQAAVEHAKVLSRSGQYATARKQLEHVLSEDVSPGDIEATKMLKKLDDPIRTSPTLTPQHVNNVVEAGQLLRKGESYFLQGQYDEAQVAYEEVLRIDPYNKAARRGIEKVIQNKADYARTAYDQRRAQSIEQVDAAWELNTPQNQDIVIQNQKIQDQLVVQDLVEKNNKLERIMVPEVSLQNATFAQALRLIKGLARELDSTELDPDRKGMNFVTRFGNEEGGFSDKIKKTRFNLELRNVPLREVLDRVTESSNTYWRAEQHAVVIRPIGSETAELETRSFRVPLGFMDDAGETDDEDVFGNTQGGLKAKQTAIDYFTKLGVAFPEGAFAFYTKANNTLRVKNTPRALESIEAFIRAQSLTEKVQVVLNVTIMEVKHQNLTELGYDWLIEPIGENNLFLGGGTQGNATVPVVGGTNPFTGSATFNADPLTAGNRSGEGAFVQDGIDAQLANAVSSSGVAGIDPVRAPSPLQLTGHINDNILQAILRGVKQKDDRSKIWVPSAVTIPGQRVEVHSGKEMIYPTEYEPAEIPNTFEGGGSGVFPVTPSTPTAFETRNLGVTIEMEPTVSDDKQHIELNVNPIITSFEGFVNYGSPIQTASIDPITGLVTPTLLTSNEILMPVFRTIRANTNVIIQDGSTMVIGGLIQQSIQDFEDKTPILGDLPLFGRFFRSEGIRDQKTAIVIFVKAELVDPTGQPWRER